MEEAIRLYTEDDRGAPFIKKATNVSGPSLKRELTRRGIPMRPRGWPGRSGPAHPAWKGGARIDKDGYIKTYAPDHPWPRRGGYIGEHVRVMELSLGRRLAPGEVVHHIDHDKRNNDLTNLRLMRAGEHSRQHGLTQVRNRDELGRWAPS